MSMNENCLCVLVVTKTAKVSVSVSVSACLALVSDSLVLITSLVNTETNQETLTTFASPNAPP